LSSSSAPKSLATTERRRSFRESWRFLVCCTCEVANAGSRRHATQCCLRLQAAVLPTSKRA
jgi:hypothetical protein